MEHQRTLKQLTTWLPLLGAVACGGASVRGEAECEAKRCDLRVTAVSPADATVDVEPVGVISVELNREVDEASVNEQTVQLLDGEASVPSRVEHSGRTIRLTPDAPLALLRRYRVSVSTRVRDLTGTGLTRPFLSEFRVRDGAWSLTEVALEALQVAPALGMSDSGDTLLAWSGATGGGCPATARWYNRGAAVTDADSFVYAHDQYCTALRTAVSVAGSGIVSWYEEDNRSQNVATIEFRAGSWGETSPRSERYDYTGTVAAASDGTMHYFGPGSDVRVWHSTPDGVWSNAGQQLAPMRCMKEPSVAIAPSGDAVAVWRSELEAGENVVLAARYQASAAVWLEAERLPGPDASGATLGEPQIAFDDAGEALSVWQSGDFLVSSHFDSANAAWSSPIRVSGGLSGFPLHDYVGGSRTEPVALSFDGSTFVVAFTAQHEAASATYLARLTEDGSAWLAPELVSDAATPSTTRMPRLAADERGNLLVVWASPSTSATFAIAYRRYDAEAAEWRDAQTIPEVTLRDDSLPEGNANLAFGANHRGLAALFLSDRDANVYRQLRLASFH